MTKSRQIKDRLTAFFIYLCSAFSVCLLVGIICYFSNKKEVENTSAYLWAALGGFVLGFIMRLAA